MRRWCPLCHRASIIGYGARCKSAHDGQHDYLWVRRGRCRLCRTTFTIHFILRCRRHAWDPVCTNGAGLGQSAPLCKDPARLPDPSTLRRWAYRGLVSLWYGAKACLHGLTCKFCRPPLSLPGIERQPAVFCSWRQTLHELAGGGLTQTADLLSGRSQQEPVLLLWERRRRCHSIRRFT